MLKVSQDVHYFILVAVLFIVPKILLRYRIPAALSAFFLGNLSNYFLSWFKGDSMLNFLSVLGITSLFLFAGLEVDLNELKKDQRFFLKHLSGGLVLWLLITLLFVYGIELNFQAAGLLALGILTPSTGFILDSLHSFELSDNERSWIRSMTIAMEVLALAILFFVLQSSSLQELMLSALALVAIVLVLPTLFRAFVRLIAPFAPHSEFSFLILLALLGGVLTRQLGTYYLIGAFVVGLTARRFEFLLPTLRSEHSLQSFRVFFSFFIPFYFFHSGMSVDGEDLSYLGILVGIIFLMIFIPVRLFSVSYSLKYFLGEKCQNQNQISLAIMPTLVFGLVIASILRERFAISSPLFTGLILHTIVVSSLPAFFLKKAPPTNYFEKL